MKKIDRTAMIQEPNIECKSITSIIGASNLLKIVFQSDDFVDWLSKYHPDAKKEEIFLGYKFFLESAIGAFALTITFDKLLGITEDYVYYRADFYGADLNKYPVTCEKTAVLKHILKQLKSIKQARTFDQIKTKTENFSNEILAPFFSITNNNCRLNSELSFEVSLKYCTMEFAHNELTNFSKWVPQGYLLSPIRQRGEPPIFESHKDKFKDEFLGYKLTLQYVWYRILGDRFEGSKLVDLHKATDWTRYISPEEMFGHKLIDEQQRTDLDRFYRITNDEIMRPIEQKWDVVRSNHLFCLDDSYSKKILEPLLSYEEKLSLTTDEKLKYTFLW